MPRTAPWMVGVKERERERAKAEKARTVYGVFKWAGNYDGGYVVRTGQVRDEGGYYFPSPYTDKHPIAISKSQKLAQRKADKLNGFK
jgi:hypothetical protein